MSNRIKTKVERTAMARFTPRTGSANFVRMFQPRFAKLVKAGTKRQTIRPVPKRMPKQGDTVSLRMWTGKPYRSKQLILRTAQINYVADVKITRNTLIIAGWYRCTKPNQAGHRDEQARLDGFRDWKEMRDWFASAYGLRMLVSTGRLPDGQMHILTLKFDDEKEMQEFERKGMAILNAA